MKLFLRLIFIRKGDYSRTYSFKDTIQEGCMLMGLNVSFRPVDKFFTNQVSLSIIECAVFANIYDGEMERRDSLLSHEEIYLSLMDVSTAKFGRMCSQVLQIFQPDI